MSYCEQEIRSCCDKLRLSFNNCIWEQRSNIIPNRLFMKDKDIDSMGSSELLYHRSDSHSNCFIVRKSISNNESRSEFIIASSNTQVRDQRHNLTQQQFRHRLRIISRLYRLRIRWMRLVCWIIQLHTWPTSRLPKRYFSYGCRCKYYI